MRAGRDNGRDQKMFLTRTGAEKTNMATTRIVRFLICGLAAYPLIDLVPELSKI
jgi:hypothetical protein